MKVYGKGGEVKITGNLGAVMKESVETAISYIRSRSFEFGINPELFKRYDIHLHVPEGATPKDGPSAGVAICVAIVSMLTGIAVHNDVAMTGEISLRGNAMIIGGLKEKLLGALHYGVKRVLIPQGNMKDLKDMPSEITEKLEIIPISKISEALDISLVKSLSPIKWHDALESVANSMPSNRSLLQV